MKQNIIILLFVSILCLSFVTSWMITPMKSNYNAVLDVTNWTNVTLENFDANNITGVLTYRPVDTFWNGTGNGVYGGTYIKIGWGYPQYTFTERYQNYSLSFWYRSYGQFTGKYPVFHSENVDAGYSPTEFLFLNNTHIVVNVSNHYKNCTNQASFTPTFEINDSKWHYYAMHNVFNGNLSLIVDGVLVNTTMNSCNESNPYEDDKGYVSCVANCPGRYSNKWEMDEVRMYLTKTTLPTINDLIAINNSGRLVPNSSLSATGLSYWITFNEMFQSPTASNSFFYDRREGAAYGEDHTALNIVPGYGENLTTLGYNVNVSIQNISNSLIFWDNGTLIYANKTGSEVFSFLDNQTIYILDNYLLEENDVMTNSPLNFTVSNLTHKHISNTLSLAINSTVSFNVADCFSLSNITYRSNSGAFNTVYTADNYTCSGNVVTLFLTNIEPAIASNEVIINYLYDPAVLLLRFKITEYEGNQTYDSSGYSFNGTLFGVDWGTDGLNVSLTENTDYMLNTSTGLFTLINFNLAWNFLNIGYGYYNTSTTGGPPEEFGFHVSILKIIAGFIAIIILIVVYVFIRNRLVNEEM